MKPSTLPSTFLLLSIFTSTDARSHDTKNGHYFPLSYTTMNGSNCSSYKSTRTRTQCLGSARPSQHSAAFGFPAVGDVSTGLPPIVTQLTSGLVTYFGLVAFFDRPCGKLLVDPTFIEAKQSQVEGAGLGLYVTSSLPEGTILGTYPGVVRPTNKYMEKYNDKPDAGTYAWRFTDNQSFIDPTDRDGKLDVFCLGGTDDFPGSYFLHETVLNSWQVPTLLARINEPPLGGGGCNVRSEENLEKREVVFSLSRDVYAGEELFMDYGLTYDRSGYS